MPSDHGGGSWGFARMGISITCAIREAKERGGAGMMYSLLTNTINFIITN